jgi:2-desacetyl-2-hydroxyethyl bacteriochlorophyllide A dehydrogenase
VKAVVIERPHEVVYREVQTPIYGPDDVLVRSHKAGVCRTDIEVAMGQLTDPRWVRFPCIPGHEWCGSIAEVGDDVRGLEVGDRVVAEGLIPCNRCSRCRAGDTHLCENYDSVGFTRGGGYGELVLVPSRVVHLLPESVSLDAAVLIEPGSVVLRGLERGRASHGEAIGVVGVGTLGSLAIRLARLFCPRVIVAYGIRAEELELAQRLGADRTVNVAVTDAEAETRKLLGGLDLVVETAGSVPAAELATRLTREGGRMVSLGIAGEGKMLELPADRLIFKDMEVIGSVGYTSAVWARMVRLVGSGLVDLDSIVTHRFPAERFEDAFTLMDNRAGIVGKVVLEHTHG